jgi:hypothetical protein
MHLIAFFRSCDPAVSNLTSLLSRVPDTSRRER